MIFLEILPSSVYNFPMAHTQQMFLLLNAILNLTSLFCLLVGWAFIRAERKVPHIVCMCLALLFSSLFLLAYLYTHFTFGILHFQGKGMLRSIYFFLLISHTLLASLLIPLVWITLSPTLKQDFSRHAQVARFTLPIWLYVSFTGGLVYLLLIRYSLS